MMPETLHDLLAAAYPNVDRMVGVLAGAMCYDGVLSSHDAAAHARAILETFNVTEGTNYAERIGHPVSAHHIWQEATNLHLSRFLDLKPD